MRVLITGAAGMVGKNLVETCPAEISILTPNKEELDLLSFETTLEYLKAYKPDMIIHSAGLVGGIQENINRPVDFLRTNTILADNVINSARACDIKNLLNLGSSCMYPITAVNPLKESSILTGPFEPTNEGYAIAKIYAYKLCQYISDSKADFHYKTIIPCNLYGKWDKFDPVKSHLIPAIIMKIDRCLKTKENVVIWGTGEVRREFMYAADFAKIIWKLVNSFSLLPNVMNVGLGHDYSIKDYYFIAAEVLGYKGKFEFDTSKPEGMKQKLVDTSLMKKFGVESTYSLREGIRETYKNYLDYYKNGD